MLERRLAKAPAGTLQSVVVATDGTLSVLELHRAIGRFHATRHLGIIDGFGARLTEVQIRRLARTPGVVRIDHDAVVRATMD